MSDHDRHAENLGAYVLGALDPDSALDLERHLAGCSECSRELRELEIARDVLPASVPPAEPPRSLRRRIMAEVRADARASADRARPARPRWALPAAGALAATAAVAAALIVAVGDGSEPALIPAQPTGASATRVVAALEREDEHGTLQVSRLPVLGRGQAYQLWIQRAGVMHPSSVFTLEPDGSAVAPVDGSLEGAEAVFLTREPLDGSAAPTSEPILEVRL